MMDNLRAAANHIVLKIILALIIISFVFTGVSGYMFGGSERSAAKVNGTSISIESFENSVKEAKTDLVQRLGQKNTDELLTDPKQIAALRENALSGLIDQELVNQYAASLKLNASDEQVKQYIRTMPRFNTKEGFDNQLYRNYLAQQGISPLGFASMVRNQLIINQLQNVYLSSDFTLPNELENIAKSAFEERKIRTATIDVNTMRDSQQVTEGEIDGYYQQNRQLFATPERIKVEYIVVDATSVQNEITAVTEQEVEDYYSKHKDLYAQATRYAINAVKVKTEDDAKAIIAELKAGAAFSALAKEKSIDKSLKLIGGDLGFIDEKALSKEMVAAGLTEKGQVSQPIPTADGYFVFQLYDVEDVMPRVRRDALADKKTLAYYQLQQKVDNALESDRFSLKGAEAVPGITVVETDWFTQDSVPDALNIPDLKGLLFDGSLLSEDGGPAANSGMLQVGGNRAFVVRVADRQPASFIPLNDAKAQIVEALKYQKALESAMARASAIVSDLSAGKGEDTLREKGLTFSEQRLVTRQTSPASKVFELIKPESGQHTYGAAVDSEGNVIVVAVDEVIAGKLPKDDELAVFNSQLLQMREIANMESLILNLRHQAKIQIEDNA